MITRKAIIIASPLQQGKSGYLPGVEADVDNYTRFFTSPIGGSWYPDEIEVLWNPTINLALKTIREVRTDYAVTVFSGHGGTDIKTRRDFINLNNSQAMLISGLTTKAKRQLAIVDACSTFVDSQISHFEGIAGIPFKSKLSADVARRLFDLKISKTDHGWTLLRSSSPGQASIDTPEGGYFSQSLLQSSSDWAARFEPKAILPVEVAYSISYRYIKKVLNARQTPLISDDQSLENRFPFALRYSHEMHYR